jgi:SsrA-binding protein
MKKKNNKQSYSQTIATNKKASHDYIFEKQLDAGIVLEGWEIKSARAGKVQLSDSYVIIKHNEAWLLGALISPLISTCTHKTINPSKTRKLLLHRKEINNLLGLTKQKGYTLIPTSMYWNKNKIKLHIALAKGKKLYDKRASDKEKTWKIEKQRILKKHY